MIRVLLLEPDTLLAKVYSVYLRKHGCSVRTVYSAQQAIASIDQHTPDVIVLEPHIAHHNGIEFMYECRSYTEWQQIPVIFISITPRERLMPLTTLVERLGIRTYLYKPTTTLARLAREVHLAVEGIA